MTRLVKKILARLDRLNASNPRVFFSILLAAGMVSGLNFLLFGNTGAAPIRWTMVDVSGSQVTGDAHLLRFPDGHVLLFDTGLYRYAKRDLVPLLAEQGVSRIDTLAVSHGHDNHYGGVELVSENTSGVGRVVFNPISRKACDQESYLNGCSYVHIRETINRLKEMGITVVQVQPGDMLYQDSGRDIRVEVLYTHDGVSEPIGRTSVNDTSLVLKLTYGSTRVLFTADLGPAGGRYLVTQAATGAVDLGADIVTAPHHGAEVAAGNDFLDRVGAGTVLVSASANSLRSDRSRRMRHYFRDNGMAVYSSGVNGHVHVELYPGRFEIRPQVESAGDTRD